MDRRVKEIVESRVREELERRKDEIENEVKRRMDVLKRSMEKQMLTELDKRTNDDIRKLMGKEVSRLPRNSFRTSELLLGRRTEETRDSRTNSRGERTEIS